MTVAVRWRPSSMEWEFRTVVSRKPPEEWLVERMEAAVLAPYGRQELRILFAREITDASAAVLEEALHRDSQASPF
jgi:hypothetical protein